jgi:hypothetical protein
MTSNGTPNGYIRPYENARLYHIWARIDRTRAVLKAAKARHDQDAIAAAEARLDDLWREIEYRDDERRRQLAEATASTDENEAVQ